MSDLLYCALWALTIFTTLQSLGAVIVMLTNNGRLGKAGSLAGIYDWATAVCWALLIVFWFN